MSSLFEDNSLDCLYWRYFNTLLEERSDFTFIHEVRTLMQEAKDAVDSVVIGILEDT